MSHPTSHESGRASKTAAYTTQAMLSVVGILRHFQQSKMAEAWAEWLGGRAKLWPQARGCPGLDLIEGLLADGNPIEERDDLKEHSMLMMCEK
jgi:hypothetical protein